MQGTIKIETGEACRMEKQYVLEWVLGEVFGFQLAWQWTAPGPTCIRLPNEKRLMLPDTFFQLAEDQWLTPETIPELQSTSSDFGELGIEDEVAIFGNQPLAEHAVVSMDAAGCTIQADLLGMLFVLMSRYEEGITETFDHHQRVPCSNTLLGRHDLHKTPWGNVYTEIIWASLERLCPGLERPARQYRLLPSHDIDFPSLFSTRSWLRSASYLAKDVVRQKTVAATVDAIRAPIGYWMGDFRRDPFDQIDWLLDQSEAQGLTSTFFYIQNRRIRMIRRQN